MTKAGLARALAQGKHLGRPPGARDRRKRRKRAARAATDDPLSGGLE